MTSNDRHANHDSPYRTGQHVSLPPGRNDLTSVSTSGVDSSRVDLALQASDGEGSYFNGAPQPSTPGTPYSPGMRSAMHRTQSTDDPKALARSHTGEIQMQNFNDGLPPAPPVSHSWKRIDRWAEDNYEELWDNLGEGCTQNDINELEHELDCTLPMEVRESLQVHDGQERGGLPTGILFGCMLLDCEEIVQEWKNWRTVNEEYLNPATVTHQSPQIPIKAFAGPSSGTTPAPESKTPPNSMWREELLARQDSQPPNAIQKAYTHPAWIPMARDWGGNCLAVDLAPGPAGKWGQVIIMGRDYDCKYLVSRSWAAFLASVADEFGTTKPFVVEESGDLKLREFKQQGVEPAFLDILRWRADQKHGRKAPRRRPTNEMRINPNAGSTKMNGSPYTSPVANEADRTGGQRMPPKNFGSPGTASPRGMNVSSPLARVAEERSAAVQIHSNLEARKDSVSSPFKPLLADTPRQSIESHKLPSVTHGEDAAGLDNKENLASTAGGSPESKSVDGIAGITGEMKNIEL